MYQIEFLDRIKTPFPFLQISALVPEIFQFEKWAKYANEMTDDVIHSTQFYMKYTFILFIVLDKRLKSNHILLVKPLMIFT